MQVFDPQALTLRLNEGFVPVFLQQVTSIQLLRTDQFTGIAGFAADLQKFGKVQIHKTCVQGVQPVDILDVPGITPGIAPRLKCAPEDG
ncbi:hypothetical protein D3C73_1312810 [compost metagenome]